jgi:hypothetical protein
MATGPSSGVSYEPILEWVLAAKWGGYTLSEFEKVDTPTQAFIMAAYRCTNQMEAVVSYEAEKKSRRPSRRGRSPK